MKKAGNAAATAFGLVLITTFFAVNMTGAFFTDSEKLQNNFTVGCNRTVIEEEFPPPDPIDPNEPADVSKSASVKNQMAVTCYVRMAVVFESDGTGEGFSITGIDTEHWANGKDGYYYYLEPLESGVVTTPLFSGIHYSGEGAENGMGSVENVICYEESVQAEHQGIPFENYQEAWDFYDGKTEREVFSGET